MRIRSHKGYGLPRTCGARNDSLNRNPFPIKNTGTENRAGDFLWRADGVGVTVQSTSSNEYRMAGRNLDIEEIFGPFDTDTRMDDDERYGNPYIRRHTEDERDRAEDYLRMVHGTRTELRDDFIRIRRRHLDETYLKGEWKIPEEEEQPDIQEEHGGALDDFLEKFTPQKTTTERSDKQE